MMSTEETGKLLSGRPAYVPTTPWSGLAAVGMSVLAVVAATIFAIAVVIGVLAVRPDFGAVMMDQTRLTAALKEPMLLTISILAWQIPMVLIALWMARSYGGRGRDVLALRSVPSLSTVLLALAGVALITIPFDIVGHVFFRDTVRSDLNPFVEMSRSSWWPVIALAIAVGAPLSEELMFRGFLQSALARTGLGFVGATLITATSWAVLHWQYSVLGLVQVFLIGLYLSWLLWRSGTLWLPIIVHGVYNAVSFTLIKTGVVGG